VIDRLSTKARRDPYGSKINRAHSPALAYATPWVSIMLASLVPQLPIASAVPLMPPLGFLALLGWRQVRPGLLPVWAGFPLGAFDDLFSGQPFGSAILLWSVAMIGFDILEARFPWRSFAQDWLAGAVVVCWYLVIAALVSGSEISGTLMAVLVPQMVISVIVFPLVARAMAGLDRFRLSRVRAIG
jgi:rod shape-determining protein MreD